MKRTVLESYGETWGLFLCFSKLYILTVCKLDGA